MPSEPILTVNGVRFSPLAPWRTLADSEIVQRAFTACFGAAAGSGTVATTWLERFASALPMTVATLAYSPGAGRTRSQVHEADAPAPSAPLGPPLMFVQFASLRSLKVSGCSPLFVT